MDEIEHPPSAIPSELDDSIAASQWSQASGTSTTWSRIAVEVSLLVLMIFVYAGDLPPMVNEAHYLVKGKNFWQPDWCQADLFAASAKAHTTFYVLFGWPTRFISLEATAWVGRFVGWTMIAVGLQCLCASLRLRPYLCLGVAVIWITGIEYGNLAGEWVIGGIEAKVPAYGLVLLALAALVRRRWNRVWIYLGSASAFHVLTGGWSVIAAMIAWILTERNRSDRHPLMTKSLFIGGAISLLGLIPAVALSYGVSGVDSATAARIYSYYRLPHHVLPSHFNLAWYARHALLLVLLGASMALCWRKSWRHRRLCGFTCGAILIAIVGLIIGMFATMVPDLAARLLRYYWFRLSDAIVPLTLAVLMMQLIGADRRFVKTVAWVVLLVSVGLFGWSSYRRARLGVPPSVSNTLLGWDARAEPETQQQVFRDWIAVCRWAKASSRSDDVFLTPRHQQTFKWYAHRAEVVSWKDVPQDVASLRQWHRRFSEVFPEQLGTIRVTIGYVTLRQFGDRYGVRFMIVDRRVTGPNLPLVRVYPTESEDNDTYAVYELPR